MTEHKCPYGGYHMVTDWGHENGCGAYQTEREECGQNGWLCKRCEQDMAGKRCADTLIQINSLWTGLEQVMLIMVDLLKEKHPNLTFKPPKPEIDHTPRLGGVRF